MGLFDLVEKLLPVGGIVLSYCVAYEVSIALHELGHAIVGKLAGLRVVACGIGIRRPLFHFRLGETHYFVARPLSGGVTLLLHDSIRTPRWRMILSVAGGPLASLLTAIGAATWIYIDERSHFVTGVAVISTFFFVTSSIPKWAPFGNMVLANDAALVTAYLQDKAHLLEQPGRLLTTCKAMRDLSRDLGSVIGEVYYTLGTALMQNTLEDAEGARESLAAPILNSANRGTAFRNLEALVRSLLALSAIDCNQEEILRQAEISLHGDSYALALVGMAAADLANSQGERSTPSVAVAKAVCEAMRERHFRTSFEAKRLIARPPEDLAKSCRELLARRGAAELDPMRALWLSSSAAQLLATGGNRRVARIFFHDAMFRMNAIARTINDESVREKFQAHYAVPLKAAVAAFDDGVPLFISNRNDADELQARAVRRNGFTPVGKFAIVFAVFVAGLLLGAVFVISVDQNRESEKALNRQALEIDDG
ncbi:MAG: hypothetical protein EXS05_08155 [Planctomycetaceae bacterium]|nr:hypothetical protein [Planctomycetaceae bacterium]